MLSASGRRLSLLEQTESPGIFCLISTKPETIGEDLKRKLLDRLLDFLILWWVGLIVIFPDFLSPTMIYEMPFCSKVEGKKMKVGDYANHHDLKQGNEDILLEIFVCLPNVQMQRFSKEYKVKRKTVRNRKQGKKMKVGDDANHHDLKQVSDFLNEANEDILSEIFVRLPNCRSAILVGSVCRCWHSLISQPEFIPRFISQHHEHQDRYSRPYTILFRKADKLGWENLQPQCFQPICKLVSKEPMFLHREGAATCSTNCLDFLPSPMYIRASCNDLLLVSPSARNTSADRYICNPITKQLYQLPKIPRPGRYTVTGHALVCMPANQFKVIEIHHPRYDDPDPESKEPASLAMKIFCSKSGKWRRTCFRYTRPKILLANYLLDVVTCNGIVYWLEYERDVDRVIALDLLNSHCGVIGFPDDFWWFRWQQDSNVREQIGVVGGELRLLQVVLTGVESIVNLKVWKLNYDKDDSSWVLVHDKKTLKRPSNEEQLVAPFVHPTSGDVVFMVWGKKVFQYNLIMEDTYEMIDELQESLNFNHQFWGYNDRLMSFPMVHPAWPTPLPSGHLAV